MLLQLTVWDVFMELNYIFRSNKQMYASTVASVPATFRLKRRNDLNPYRTVLFEKLTVAQLAPELSHYIQLFLHAPKSTFPWVSQMVSPFRFLGYNSVRISHLRRHSAHFIILHLITLAGGTKPLDDIKKKICFWTKHDVYFASHISGYIVRTERNAK